MDFPLTVLADEDKTKFVEELATLQKNFEEEKSAWAKEKALKENTKQLKTWKTRCLDYEKKNQNKEKDMKNEIEALKKELTEEKEGRVRLEFDMVGLQKYIITKHDNNFINAIHQVKFFYQEVTLKDARFDVNKGIFKGRLIDEDEITTTEAVENKAMVKDVEGEESREETVRASPSVVFDQMNKDEKNTDNGVDE
ncbi:hypothetical protein LR48_Vigan462s001900 [Vigna angularis]|uniref:Uncharacterized protein n=1 Tax=Phaseolus angularis TaxID=3914 RepID=A0A0L9TBI7_PHAAN|nr:hypothetical protein LR48_Vigan462s001900 [Vigna angularis]